MVANHSLKGLGLAKSREGRGVDLAPIKRITAELQEKGMVEIENRTLEKPLGREARRSRSRRGNSTAELPK